TFARFAQAPGQRFVCCADDDAEGDEYVAHIEHKLNPGAGAGALQTLRNTLGGLAGEFQPFFERFDGATLFADKRSDAAGISIAPIELWGSLTEPYLEDLENYDLFSADELDELDREDEDEDYDDEFEADEDDDDEPSLPAWMYSAVVIGEVTDSGNPFVVATEGDERGNIYYFDHEVLEPELFASSFQEFLARIVYCDPPRLLMHLGGYARYSDGRTATQWLPRRYVAGPA
ncbi:MAG TPA: SMI1/KNR4 family protein, partial [Burkholderiales bacterium]|nr:SMI1/KNR4 family protein [Burkholderiales bacterium]